MRDCPSKLHQSRPIGSNTFMGRIYTQGIRISLNSDDIPFGNQINNGANTFKHLWKIYEFPKIFINKACLFVHAVLRNKLTDRRNIGPHVYICFPRFRKSVRQEPQQGKMFLVRVQRSGNFLWKSATWFKLYYLHINTSFVLHDVREACTHLTAVYFKKV